MKNILVLAFIFLTSVSSVQASELTVLFGGWSNHQIKDNDYNFNQFHNILGIKYNNIIVTTFENSYYNRSHLLAYQYDIFDYKVNRFSQSFSLVGGVVTGYTADQVGAAYLDNNLSLYLLPTVTTSYHLSKDLKLSIDNGLLLADNGYVVTTNLSFSIKF